MELKGKSNNQISPLFLCQKIINSRLSEQLNLLFIYLFVYSLLIFIKLGTYNRYIGLKMSLGEGIHA